MALEGTLEDMSLLDLFQVFEMGDKSGVLILQQPSVVGVVYVLCGQGRDALTLQLPDRAVMRRGEAAVVDMLRWASASFRFRHDLEVAHRPVSIVHDWQWLKQVACCPQQVAPVLEMSNEAERTTEPSRGRRVEEGSTVSRQTAPSKSIISPDVPLLLVAHSSSTHTIKFNVDEWRVLSWIAQGASARQIAATTGFELTHVLFIVDELYKAGLVKAGPSLQVKLQPQRAAATFKAPSPHRTTLTTAVTPERHLIEAVMRRIRGA